MRATYGAGGGGATYPRGGCVRGSGGFLPVATIFFKQIIACILEEVSHRGSLDTTCRDEGILAGNNLITLSQTPLTSSLHSLDMTILLGHSGDSRLLFMGMPLVLLSHPMLLSHAVLPTGHPGSCSRSSHPTVSQPDCPATLCRAQIPYRHGWGSPPQFRPPGTALGPVASGTGMYKDHGPSRRKLVMFSLGNGWGTCLPSRYSPNTLSMNPIRAPWY